MTVRQAELAALRTHLRRALCLLLITPAGCTDGAEPKSDAPPATAKPEPTIDREPDPDGEVPIKTSTTAEPTTAIAPEPVELFMPPSCPSGTWCGTEELAAKIGHKDELAPSDFEGCAGSVKGESSQAELAAYDGLSLGLIATVDVEATKAKRVEQPDACCYRWTISCPGGRPLLDDGEPQLAHLQAGTGWTAPLPNLDRAAIARLSRSERRELAVAWLADARMEHSSIASFARARIELEAVGAPAGLLLACEHAALDERRHARICFGLAAAYGGAPVEPVEFSPPTIRTGGLIRVALDVFLEGCVGETVAAACVRRAASEAYDPTLARLLERIADDEGDHAALAWQTLAWAIDRGGVPVQRAIVALADRLRPSGSDPIADAHELAPGHGQLDAASQARVRHDAWAAIIDPLVRDLTRL